ncbi:MAG: IPT/TIG domain-containing protein [Acidobacteria bacterium]|nr:IPT/TIG domain-containing protein [Acidobacteriota bacterium]
MALFGSPQKHPAAPYLCRLILAPAVVALSAFFLVGCGGGTTAPSPPPNTSPSISSISPTGVAAGSGGFTLEVNGSNFNSSSMVRWAGSNRATDYVSSTRLEAAIPASDIAAGGTRTITVRNTSPSAAVSNGVTFNINNLVPALNIISPKSIPAESGSFTLMIFGENFVENSSLQWGSNTLYGNYVDATQMAFTISAAYISGEGNVSVSVSNPPPGGGSSAALPFTVRAPGLAVLTRSLPDAHNSKSYAYTLRAEGGVMPYSWSIAAGSLPAGLNLSQGGEISGTAPMVASDTSYPFTVSLDDSAGSNTGLHDFSLLVRSVSPGRNDTCGAAAATPISNGVLRASISPYGDVDVYTFRGTQGSPVTAEIFAQRLDTDEDPAGRDIYLDSYLEILDSACAVRIANDDMILGVVYDSLIENYLLPYTGTYYIRVSDLRGDGRPDFLYDLSLSGAD